MNDIKLVDSISHTEIRNILLKRGIRWRHSKTILGNSKDPEYDIKKVHWETEIQYTPIESVLLYEDEKGPISAKTYGGTSWSLVQSKTEKAQKIKGILNVFGVYDHTNKKMVTHCYKNRNGDQLVSRFYQTCRKKIWLWYKQIFLVLDNISIHKANKVRENIQKYHPRINLVFLPTRSPDLNLIEVRWLLWMQRQVINNSIFRNEYEIGKIVSDWTNNYNKKHSCKVITNILHEQTIGVLT
jgi:hypothetical protein